MVKMAEYHLQGMMANYPTDVSLLEILLGKGRNPQAACAALNKSSY